MGSDDIAKKRISANKERRNSQKETRKARNVGNRSIIPNILILTEGYSENIYFNKLIQILSLGTVKSRKSISTACTGILREAEEEAIKLKDTEMELNYIFCIFDLDTVRNKRHLEILSKINSDFTQIIPIYSFPCIEIWFLLHYECNPRPFQSKGKKSIGDTVKEHFKKTYAPEYSETNTDIIEALATQYNHAIHNSIRLYEQQVQVNSNNPITNIHSLVLLLKNISDRTQNYSFDEQYQCFIEAHI